MRIHEVMADNRVRFAQRLNEMSEELANLAKEVDKNRKAVRCVASFSSPLPLCLSASLYLYVYTSTHPTHLPSCPYSRPRPNRQKN